MTRLRPKVIVRQGGSEWPEIAAPPQPLVMLAPKDQNSLNTAITQGTKTEASTAACRSRCPSQKQRSVSGDHCALDGGDQVGIWFECRIGEVA
jgi:hypothetical protein